MTGKIRVEITGDGSVTYYNNDTGKCLLEESWIDGRVHTAPLRRAREYRVQSGNYFRMSLYFKAQKNEYRIAELPVGLSERFWKTFLTM